MFASANNADRAERVEYEGMDCGTPAAQVYARRDEQLPTYAPAGADAKVEQPCLNAQIAKRQNKRAGTANEGGRSTNEYRRDVEGVSHLCVRNRIGH